MFVKCLTTFISIILMGVLTTAHAGAWAEREALAKIIMEIDALEHLIRDTSKMNQNDMRLRFDYDALMRDLTIVRNGIDEYLGSPMNPVLPSETIELLKHYVEKNN